MTRLIGVLLILVSIFGYMYEVQKYPDVVNAIMIFNVGVPAFIVFVFGVIMIIGDKESE